MADLVMTNAYVTINGVDLSDHVTSITWPYSAELVDNTAMGAGSTRSRIGGLKDWSVTLEMKQDYAASEVDATLFPLVGSTFTIASKPVNAAASPTNPQYSGTGILENYQVISGNVGELGRTSITIQAAGTLARATS